MKKHLIQIIKKFGKKDPIDYNDGHDSHIVFGFMRYQECCDVLWIFKWRF